MPTPVASWRKIFILRLIRWWERIDAFPTKDFGPSFGRMALFEQSGENHLFNNLGPFRFDPAHLS